MIFLIQSFRSFYSSFINIFPRFIFFIIVLLMISCSFYNKKSSYSNPDIIQLSLIDLELSDGELSPSFDPEITKYTAKVDAETTKITIRAITANSNTKLTINDKSAYSGRPSASIDLKYGSNLIKVLLTSNDGDLTRLYKLIITRKNKINNNSLYLTKLQLSEGELSPSFDPEVTQYTVEVEAEISKIIIKAMTANSNTNLTINGKSAHSGLPSVPIKLDHGSNHIEILLTSNDEKSTLSYNLIVTRKEVNIDNDSPYIHIDSALNTNFSFNVDLGAQPTDVYFIFTNTSTTRSIDAPIFNLISENKNSIQPQVHEEEEPDFELDKERFMNGKPFISEFNSNPHKYIERYEKVQPKRNLYNFEPRFDIVNNVTYFSDSNGSKVRATCRKTIAENTKFGGKTVNIYVADNCWNNTGSKRYNITQKMVDELGENFLKSGENNDIYDWVTSIMGEEWGDANNRIYIPKNDNITILLTDIDNDNSSNGGTLGYFFSLHNFKKIYSGSIKSNERIMFFVDAVMFARKDGASWDISDVGPTNIMSALAHELQHMIHFYQKNVKLRAITSTWLNEMCSMVVQDLVANKVQSDGPRGVYYGNSSSGYSRNYRGRLPLYNYYNDIAVADWDEYDENESMKNYSIAYALGSFLARNFGGAVFFRDVVQNRYPGHRAIEHALKQARISDDFGEILQKWGVANLLSDRTNVEIPYKYNNDGWFSDLLGYNIGSINLYNYSYGGSMGPKIYSWKTSESMPKTSNRYYLAGRNLTGEKNWDIQMDSGGNCRLTVVKKK